MPNLGHAIPSVAVPPSRAELRWVWLIALAATLALAIYSLRQVLERAGHPAVPLDDAFIHFQYARRMAEGHGLSYVDGEGSSSGATSLLWPAVLALFHALGFRDLAIIWPAWFLGFAALAALTVETYRVARPLTGRGGASGAAAMVLCFGGYMWCAGSGMEVVPLAWALAWSVRLSADWREAPAEQRTRSQRHQLWLVALAAPLIRPEGALASLLVVIALATHPAAGQSSASEIPSPTDVASPRDVPPTVGRPLPRFLAWLNARRAAFLPVLGPLLVPLLNWITTGHAASSTTIVKWLPANPYYGHGHVLFATIAQNVRLLFDTLLDGREWSALVLPEGSRPIALAALAALPALGFMRGRQFRAMCVLLIALGMLIPCTYLTFLWNRLRYLWPFAFAWFVGVACAAHCVAELLAQVHRRLLVVGTAISWACALALASHLPWTSADLAESASAIDRQQVALGRWAQKALPAHALIGVNDTGAIAYLGGHRTFDVVGLTTPGEARYWVAGAGARFEHYERLQRTEPAHFPSHFIVYPNWMACDPVLGDELYSATVLDQTILGGTTMTAFEARRDLLGSGELPVRARGGLGLSALRAVDELDVADLESEALHRYQLGASRETASVTLVDNVEGRVIADGARIERRFDRFELAPGGAAWLVARFAPGVATKVDVRVDGTLVGQATMPSAGFSEPSWPIPASEGTLRSIEVTVLGPGTFGSAHYWLFAR